MTQAEVTNRFAKGFPDSDVGLFGWGVGTFHAIKRNHPFPEKYDARRYRGQCLIEEYGKEVGRQCREMGIHINFAPDMDVNSNVDNPVIGLRSFGENPERGGERYCLRKRIGKYGHLVCLQTFPWTWRYF